MKEVDFKAQQNSEEVQQEETVSVENEVIVETVETKVEETAEETVENIVEDAVEKPAEEPADETVVTEVEETEEADEGTEDSADAGETEFDEKESEKRLEALEEKRSIADLDADKHRKQRDEYHDLAREWKAKRDSLNAQVRDLVAHATESREKRDEYNNLVRESKALRDEWNEKVSDFKVKMAELRPERADKEKPRQSLEDMRRHLRRLEIQQQTATLTKDAEEAIVRQISEMAKAIDERASEEESSLEQNTEFKKIHTEFKEAKAKAETHHAEMTEYADKAQSEHENMISFYDQADRIRKEADAAQSKHVEYRNLGDKEHKKHIEIVGALQETDKEAASLRNRKTSVRRRKAEAENKKEAKEIFERFKNGEKLSTDDLMALQRSGYL